MKPKAILLIIILTFVICSCITQSLIQSTRSESALDDDLFNRAENLFQAHSYDNALNAYKEYLAQNPYGSKADLSLMRLAAIYSEQKNQEAMLMAYRRLIADYPESLFVADAMVKILVALYDEGKFKQVILQASAIIEKTDSTPHIFRTYAILGDTYMALGSPKDAIFFYHIAYQKAQTPEERHILLKLKAVISQLSTEDILSLLLRLDNKFLKSYLMYQLGVHQYEKQNYQEALKIFSEFIRNFPDHEEAGETKNLIGEINQRFAFKRRLIGCLMPLSGPYETFGKRALKGIQFALNQFNSQNNQPVSEIIVKDTASEPQLAIRALRQLDVDGVSLIMGPIITGKDAAREAQQRGIPIITLTQKIDIHEIGDYVFRIFLTPQMQVDAIVPYVVERLGLVRFAILYPEDVYGNTFMEVFRDKVIDYGATVVAVESYKSDQTDFAVQIKKLAKMYQSGHSQVYDRCRQNGSRGKNRHAKSEVIVDFDAIFIPDVAEKIALIAPQLAYYDIDNVLLLGTNLWHSERLTQTAGKYVQKAIIADVFYAESSEKQVKKFISTFEASYGEPPGFIEALAYDATMIGLHALSNPGVRSRKDLKGELKGLRAFKGVTGLTSFKENGDAQKKLYLLQIEGNIFVELKSN
jgi:branched-chain amino acid transport system substrate-binding protein